MKYLVLALILMSTPAFAEHVVEKFNDNTYSKTVTVNIDIEEAYKEKARLEEIAANYKREYDDIQMKIAVVELDISVAESKGVSVPVRE